MNTTKIKKCGVRSCRTCPYLEESNSFFSNSTGERYFPMMGGESFLNCKSENIIYLISCRICTSIFRIENVNYHFLTHPPLQPKRNMIEAWNLACLVLRGVVLGPSRRFLICRPWAKIWGRGGSAQGVVKNHKKFFSIFLVFSL